MEKLSYRVIRSNRKTLAVQILPDGQLIVRSPRCTGIRAIERFLADKREWIEKHLPKQEDILPKLTDEKLHQLAQQALAVIPERTAWFARLLGVSYGRITIRNQRTRWGSCSGQGNLNFNCLLMLMPDRVMDYVIVHELCHRKEMNHSPRFWAEVERVMPDYKECRRWLKENGSAIIGQMEL